MYTIMDVCIDLTGQQYDRDDIVSRKSPKWVPVRVLNGHTVRSNIARHARHPDSRTEPLPEMSKRFLSSLMIREGWVARAEIEKEFRLPPDFSYAELGAALLKSEAQVTNPYAEMKQLMKKAEAVMGEAFASQCFAVVNQIADRQRAIAAEEEHTASGATADDEAAKDTARPDGASAAPAASAIAHELNPAPPKRRRKQQFGDFDLKSRDPLPKLKDGHAKLRLLQQCHQELIESDAAPKSFTNSLRLFVTQTMQPILHCLATHFDEDESAFVESWRQHKFKHGKYASSVCIGGDVTQCKLVASYRRMHAQESEA